MNINLILDHGCLADEKEEALVAALTPDGEFRIDHDTVIGF